MSNSAQPLPLPLSVRRPQVTFPAGAFSVEAKARLHNGRASQMPQGDSSQQATQFLHDVREAIKEHPGCFGLPRNTQEEFEAQAAAGKINVLRHFA